MLSSYTYSILYSPMSRALMTALLFLAMVSLGWGQVVDEYRTRQSGNWNANTTWERYNGTIWQNLTGTSPLVPPNSGDNIITIRSTHTVTVTSSVTVDQVVVAAGGQVTINSGNTLTINNGTGTDLSVSGTIQTNSTSNNAGFTNNGTIVFNDGGTYIHNVNGETIPTATWDANSNCNITGVTVDVPGGLTPVNGFGNFTWNTIGVNNLSLGGTLNTINGDFTIMSTGTGSISLGGTASGNLTVGGNFVQIGGTFKGNFSQGDGANRTLTINGNFSLSGGTFDFSGATNNFSLSVYLAGNFSHTNGTLTESGNGTANYIYFNGTSMQTYTSGGTVSNTINFTVNSGAYLQMAASSTTVTGGGSFTLQSGATLGIRSTGGIMATATNQGHIQVSGTRTYSPGAHYIYNHSANQNSGDGIPNNLTGSITIANTGSVNNYVALNIARTIANGGTINLLSGIFSAESNLTMASTSTINRSDGSMAFGFLQGSGAYDVNYLSNYKATGPELWGSGLRNVTVNLTSGETLSLSGSWSPDGNLTLTSGTFRPQGANYLNTAPVIMNGGTLQTGISIGYSQTTGILDLTENSIIAFSTGSHSLTFANSSGESWTPAKTLTITGWTGNYNGTGGTGGKLFVGSDANGLTTTQLGQILFKNGTNYYSATILALTGEVVPLSKIVISEQTGLWSENTTWLGGVVPVSTDHVIIKDDHFVTVDGSYTCAELIIGRNNDRATLRFLESGKSLTVSGTVYVGDPDNTTWAGRIQTYDGSVLTAASLILGLNQSGTPEACVINMNSGGAIQTGSLAIGSTGSGTPFWIPGTGTVVMTGTSTLPATIFTSFNNLEVQTGGALSFSANTAIAGDFSIASGATANLGAGLSHTAGTLTLGGSGTASGTWGHSASTAANVNDVYFASATGIITVGSNTCTAPTFSYSKTNVTCHGGDDGSIKVTVTGGIANYEFSKDGGSTWTTPQASNEYTFSDLTVAEGPYNIAVRDGSGCVQTECD